ncbi:MAG: hypothetical protein ACU85U_05490 [Gammaproteobacteria bacterium]
MMQAVAVPDPAANAENTAHEATLDLAALAQVARGERVEVESISDRTLDLFEKTLQIVDEQSAVDAASDTSTADPNRFVPEHLDLRQRFLFAETLGSYSTLQDLLDGYSPAHRLSQDFEQKSLIARLTANELAALEEYRNQIHDALIHANEYLLANVSSGYSADELQELNTILYEARARFETVNSILGTQLIYEIEDGVRRLYAFQDKIRSVQQSIDGIFLVDHEVMFMPTNDLVAIVNTVFKAVGNPYVAEHIDGILLLAARNLLIQAVSFYSYYGKQQIYTAFKRNQTSVNRTLITRHVRSEIRKLFRACMTDNKLVLKRVMNNAEREFEISVDAIRSEAERSAVAAVNMLIPEPIEREPEPEKSLMARISRWLFR